MSDGLTETVCRDIDAAREELIELCGHLVAAASINPPGRTADVADVVRAYLSGHGIGIETIAARTDATSSSTRTWIRWKPAMRPRGRFRSCVLRAVTAASTGSAWAI